MDLIGNTIDVLVFAETNLDSSFPKGQCEIPGYKQPNRFHKSYSSGSPLVFVNGQFSSNTLVEIDTAPDIQILPMELNSHANLASVTHS